MLYNNLQFAVGKDELNMCHNMICYVMTQHYKIQLATLQYCVHTL